MMGRRDIPLGVCSTRIATLGSGSAHRRDKNLLLKVPRFGETIFIRYAEADFCGRTFIMEIVIYFVVNCSVGYWVPPVNFHAQKFQDAGYSHSVKMVV